MFMTHVPYINWNVPESLTDDQIFCLGDALVPIWEQAIIWTSNAYVFNVPLGHIWGYYM